MADLIQSMIALAVYVALPAVSFADETFKTIPTAASVDLESYVGRWYEIRRIENEFQDNEPRRGDGPCFNTTAEYTSLRKGRIGVKNTCMRSSGPEIANGKARAVKGSNNSKLKVNFTGIPLLEWLGIGDGDYWILALGEKNSEGLYSWVLIGAPDLNYGWILARTPTLEGKEIENALSVAESVGYDRNVFKPFRR